jgi:hypothetical protein
MFRYIVAVLTPSGGETIEDTVGTLVNAVHVDDHGAVGDGTTNDTAAFIAAIAAANTIGGHVLIGKKTYVVPGDNGGGSLFAAFKLNAGQWLIGEDRETSIIKVTGDARGLQLSEEGSGCANLTFQGPGIGAGLLFNTGVVIYGNGVTIKDCLFKDFSGSANSNGGGGVLVLNLAALSNFKRGSSILNCDFTANVCGLNTYAGGEYINYSVGRLYANTTAIVNRGGNNKYSNLNFNANTTAFSLQTGSNDGHGVMSNCTVNHNTTNLLITSITQGFKFVGCMFYEGNITITGSTRIAFTGCDLVGSGTLTLTSNTSIKVGAECYYPTSGGDALTKVLTGTDISVV